METTFQGPQAVLADKPAFVSVLSLCLAVFANIIRRMMLGHVYDMDLKKNESLIKEVIIQAQGEV